MADSVQAEGIVWPLRLIYVVAPRLFKPFCPPHLYASSMDVSTVVSTSARAVDQPFGPYLIGSYVGLMYANILLVVFEHAER